MLSAESGRSPAGLRARRLLRSQVPQEEEQVLQQAVRGEDDSVQEDAADPVNLDSR